MTEPREEARSEEPEAPDEDVVSIEPEPSPPESLSPEATAPVNAAVAADILSAGAIADAERNRDIPLAPQAESADDDRGPRNDR